MGRTKRQSTAKPLLLTIPDVAVQLGVCRATVYRLMHYNKLPYIEVGGVRRIDPVSLNGWLKQNEIV